MRISIQEIRNGSQVSKKDTEANLREHLASTKESYDDALRELRQDRISWKVEKQELRDLKQRVGESSSPKQPPLLRELQLQRLREEKAKHEGHLETFADQIEDLRGMVMELRQENQGLRGQVANFKSNNHGTVIQDLEEEVGKWETLYFESTELGSSRMGYLERELEQLRASSCTRKESADSAQEQISTLYEKLQTTFVSAKLKDLEFKSYKQKSQQRVLLLKEMVEQAHAEKDKELLEVKAQQEDEISLLGQIEHLEHRLSEEGHILERERAEASKRESELTRQLKKARKLANLKAEDADDAYHMQDVLSVFARKLGERLCGCLTDDETKSRLHVHNQVPILL